MNADNGWNVLDIVALANCVLADSCGDPSPIGAGCPGELNGDGGHNVLDIVTLANCVLAEDCGDKHSGNPELDTKEAYTPPKGMSEEEHKVKIKDVLTVAQNATNPKDKQIQRRIVAEKFSKPSQ